MPRLSTKVPNACRANFVSLSLGVVPASCPRHEQIVKSLFSSFLSVSFSSLVSLSLPHLFASNCFVDEVDRFEN
jgi:hypothetical protein